MTICCPHDVIITSAYTHTLTYIHTKEILFVSLVLKQHQSLLTLDVSVENGMDTVVTVIEFRGAAGKGFYNSLLVAQYQAGCGPTMDDERVSE